MKLSIETSKALETFKAHPTERNECYMTGFASALWFHNVIDWDTYDYLMKIIGQYTEIRKTEEARK